MKRRRWQVVAAVVVVLAASAAAVLLAAHRGNSGAGTVPPGFTLHPGSDRGVKAFQALNAASVPGPLSGSTAVGTGSYVTGGGCEQARSRYQSAGAPLPAGARAVTQPDGVMLIDAPYGPSGIVFKEGDGVCYYQVLARPSVIVIGKGPAPTGSAFVKVGCFLPVDQGGSEFAALTINGTPYVIQIGPTGGTDLNSTFDPSQGETALVFQGTLADLRALGQDASSTPDPAAFHGRGGMYPAKVMANSDGSITATLTGGDAGGTVITVACNTDLVSVLPAATPAP